MIMKQKTKQIICRFKNFVHLCGDNLIDYSSHAKFISNDKKAAYGCKSRDFSAMVDWVVSDRLLFINPKTF